MWALKNVLFLMIVSLLLKKAWNKSIMLQKVINGLNDTKSNNIVQNQDNLVDDVAPPKHLDAVKIDRDGKLNSNFHKEVFLGEDVENFDKGSYKLKDQRNKLEEIFNMIDADKSKYLEIEELTNWVLLKSQEHFAEAKAENQEKFEKLDTDHDGLLFWTEFLVEFLVEKGYDKEKVAAQLNDPKTKSKIEITDELKEEIDRLRDKWSEAVSEDKPEQLNSSQFLDFQHPESSQSMLEYLVEDFIHDLDMDETGNLTIHEYLAVAPDSDVNSLDDMWIAQRRKEFREVIDQDHDGILSKNEIANYLDPRSKTMAEQEARQLISFGDDDEDGKLSLGELLENSQYYTGSKLYNYAKSVHEEF